MEPSTTNGSYTKIIGALVIGLLVGFAAGAFWQDRRAGSEEQDGITEARDGTSAGTASVATGTSQTNSLATTTASLITVTDQPAGSRVELVGFDSADVVWIAVREVIDGAPGNILGAQKVPAGIGQKVSIDLLRPTIAEGIYRIVLYRDVGTPAFNYREDVLIEGVEGTFTAR